MRQTQIRRKTHLQATELHTIAYFCCQFHTHHVWGGGGGVGGDGCVIFFFGPVRYACLFDELVIINISIAKGGLYCGAQSVMSLDKGVRERNTVLGCR